VRTALTMGKEAPEATDRSATAAAWTAPPALMSSQPPQRRRRGTVGDHGADAGDRSESLANPVCVPVISRFAY
jgi:hypothetical protein